jgi:putative SOS response-associated peptidase YedK
MIDSYFGVTASNYAFREEVYPGHYAPIIFSGRGVGEQTEALNCVPAVFGLIPNWSKDGKNYRHTYNARSETVFEKPSFRSAWRKRQFCVVPMQAFYEPSYATGNPIRWRIERNDRAPFAVAAIYDTWKNLTGEIVTSFSMLTVNADGHPVMGKFHRPGDEKRSLVVVDRESVSNWLRASTDLAVTYLSAIPASQFEAAPAPIVR